jgi:hypothetical protein
MRRLSCPTLLLSLSCTPEPYSVPDTGADTGEAAPILERLALPAHPRTLVHEADRALLEDRIAGAGEDGPLAAEHAERWAAIQSRCDGALPEIATDPIDLGATWSAAAQARDCAFIAWLQGDTERGQKAATILEGLPPDAHDIDDVTTEVHLATAIQLASQAWDLLAGTDLGLELEPSRAAVAALTVSMWEAYVQDWPQLYQAWQNNHNVKTAAAFGLAGLALDDEPMGLTWVGYAQTEIQHIQLGVQATPTGAGYGEGPGYHSYGSQTAQPFLWAYHRLFEGQTYRWPVTCATRPAESCEEGDHEPVGDLWEDPRLLEQLLWNVRLRMPDGARAPFDDSWRTGFPSGMMAPLDPLLAWDWLDTDDGYQSWSADVDVETLLNMNELGEAPSHEPCWADPETGVAVLASDHGPGATWAMLLAEPPGPMTSWGHEHADAGSFMLHARGAYLVIDPGYPGYTMREQTAGYEHHTGILVGGEGLPTGTAGDLEVSWDDPLEGCSAATTMSWDDHRWRRQLSLDQGAIVVRDELDLAQAQALQWRLPTMSGEGRGSLELHEHGALLRQDSAGLLVVITSDQALSIAEERGPDAPHWGSVLEHELMTASTAATNGAWFFAVLLPIGPEDDPAVSVSGETISIDGHSWIR